MKEMKFPRGDMINLFISFAERWSDTDGNILITLRILQLKDVVPFGFNNLSESRFQILVISNVQCYVLRV